MIIESVPARDDQLAVVQNLFAFYIYDISEFGGLDVSPDGRFDVPAGVASYWHGPLAGSRWRPEWHGLPFLVHVDAILAGFALVKRIATDPATFDMGEFFILRRFRRRGVGRQVACDLFNRHPGRWEVREMPSNAPAQKFWRRIIADYTGGALADAQEWFESYGADFVVQRFNSMNRAIDGAGSSVQMSG